MVLLTKLGAEMAQGHKRKGTNTLMSPFLLPSNLLPVPPLGVPEGFQFPRVSVQSHLLRLAWS